MKSPMLKFLGFLMMAVLATPAWAETPWTLQVDDGLPMIVTPTEDYSSATNETNQQITFEMVQDCKVDGVVVIPKGTIVRGKVELAEHSKMFGRQGKLQVSFTDTNAGDGSDLLVRASVDRKGNIPSTTQDKIVGLLPYGIGMVPNGKDAVLPAGAPLTIFIHGTVKFHVFPGGKIVRLPEPVQVP